jgi:integrase
MAKTLTELAVSKAKPGYARREIPDGHTRGLFLVVHPTGRKGWVFRYRHNRHPKKLTLGPCPEIPLAEARTLASAARVKVAHGQDPAAEKRSEKQAALDQCQAERDSLPAIVDAFIERCARPNTREATWKEQQRLLRKHVLAFWPGKRLPQITRPDVHELLDSIMDQGKPILANRTFEVVRRMCNWSVERGIIKVSPCDGVKPPAAERSRDRVHDDRELRAIWKACNGIGVFGPLVRLLVLTGQRRDEVAEMRWSEVDLAGKTWVLPRNRSKNGVEHLIPLSEAAISVLAPVLQPSSKEGLVFTTNGRTAVSGFSRCKKRLDELVEAELDGEIAHWTLHDLRRTAASGMARLGQPVHVVEAVLNHRSGTIRGVARVYNRHDYAAEKRTALEAWARHVEMLLANKPGDNAIELGMARA